MTLTDQNTFQNYALNNRHRLLDHLPDDACVLVMSGEETIRNLDVDYPFRAQSDFFYLTAFTEPDSVLVLSKQQYVIFLREKDAEKETWQGRRVGTDAAPEALKVDRAFEVDLLEELLPELVENSTNLFFSFTQLAQWSDVLQQIVSAAKAKSRQGVEAPHSFHDLDRVLHELRLIKQPLEIEWMRQAAQMSVAGHKSAMQAVQKLKTERQLQGALENGFWQAGAYREAFNSICAGGENACILHYTENNQRLNATELVLVDAGAEYNFYAGDITTTFPIGGRFTEAQAQIYSLVLKAQKTVIEMVQPGVLYHELHEKTVRVLTEGLLELGILQGDLETLIEEKACFTYFMHGTGHWLGMDVHDVGAYKVEKAWRPLEPGMVITVEPGLYLSEQMADLDQKWHSIGVRIEDDVLVTETGYEVLTHGLPRTVQEIEAYMAEFAEDGE